MKGKNSLLFGPRTRQNILNGRVIRKLQNGGDVFEDYWTDSDGESSTLSKISNHSAKKPEKLLNIKSSTSIKTSGYKNSSRAIRHSPKKIKDALLNNSVSLDEVEHVNKETCATSLEDVTVNLGSIDNNFQCESSNNACNNEDINLSSELPHITPAVIPEIQSIDHSPLSRTYNKKNETFKVISKISFKNSKKSISRSTKKDKKIKDLQLHYDEYDEKIMQMIYTNDESGTLSVASEEDMPLPIPGTEMKGRSKVKKRVSTTSKNIQQRKNAPRIESQNHKVSPSKIIKKTKSRNKRLHNAEPVSFENHNHTISQSCITEKDNSTPDKNNFVPNENILKKSKFINSSNLQTTRKQNTAIEKDFNCAPMNSFESSVDNISEINTTKTFSKRKVIENNKSRQKTLTNKKSDFVSEENNFKRTDCDVFFQPQISKKQKKLTSTNSLVNTSVNNFENSVDNVSEVNTKTTSQSQKKINKGKNRHVCDENNLEDQHSAKAKVFKKSKFSSTKKNLVNAYEQTNHATAIRRSSRQKFAPLAHWRNERLRYRFENGGIKTIGIDKGTNEDDAFMKQLCNTIYGRQNQKYKKVRQPKKAKIIDITENREKLLHVHKKFPLIPWDLAKSAETNKNSEHEFLIKRMIDTNRNSFGYVQIDVGKTKPTQFMPADDLLLTVVNGKVEIHLHKNVYVVENKDMIIVPCGTPYTIKNIGNKKASLVYVVGKFRFFDKF